MPVLPLSKNIGPGNVPNPSTSNWVDGVAYAHDIAYGSAKTQQDIRAADSEFINQVLRVPDSNPIVAGHQLLSLLGIGLKKGVENVFGPVYPNNLPENAPMQMQVDEVSSTIEEPPTDSGASPAKRQKTKANKGKKGMDNTQDEGSSMVAPGAMNKLMSIPCPTTTNLGNFKRCYTYDLELVTYNPKAFPPNATVGVRPWWVAPCYTFCVEELGWYLSRGDINFISRVEGNWKVKHCGGSITLGTITSPFATATASSTQTSANTHTNVTLYSGKGLEYHYQMYNARGTVGYSTTSGEFELSGITLGNFPKSVLHEFNFGATPLDMPATQVIRSYNNLTCFPYSTTIANQANINSVPNYRDKLTKAIQTTAGSVLNQWSYEPSCYLRLQNTVGAALNGTVGLAAPTAFVTLLADGASTVNDYATSGEASSNGTIDQATTIRFNNYRNLAHGEAMDPVRLLPREYIGFLPPTTISGTAVQPIKIHIQVKTEIELEHSVNTDYFTNASTTVATQRTQFRFPTASLGSMKRFIESGGSAAYSFQGLEGMGIV